MSANMWSYAYDWHDVARKKCLHVAIKPHADPDRVADEL